MPLIDAALERQVDKYLNSNPGLSLRLKFPHELEARFELERLEQRSRQVMFTGIVAIVFYDLFLFADYVMHPGVIWRCILIRLCAATPVVMLTAWAVHRRVKSSIRETLVLASVLAAGGGVLGVSYNIDRIDSLFSQTGFLLIVFFGVLVLRQEFVYAIVTLALMFCEDLIFLGTDRWMTTQDKVGAMFILVASLLLTLMANFMMEREERLSFAHFLKEGFNGKALIRLNQKLTALSQVDGLTGLSNRRHFEEQFREHWQEAIDEGKALSLLMVDIDHFKKLNDTYGHIAGDRVLIQMGQVLLASVRASDDLVARYGGEEFIILLVDADHEAAHRIAEELRKLVCNSPIMPEDGVPPGSVTVSCGLATSFPQAGAREDDDRLKLVGEADLALYAAKRAGRNRVSCRACEALQPERRGRPEAANMTEPDTAARLDVRVR